MRPKHILIIVLIIILISIIALKFVPRNSDSIFLRISNIIYDNNRIELNCIDIDRSNVDVIWRTEKNEKTIIKSGKQVSAIGNEYGPNALEVKISNGIVFKLGNWKTANWHTHNYRIDLKKIPQGYKVNFLADGPDFERSEQEYDLTGKLVGSSRSYFNNGNLSVKATYYKGSPEGQFKYYYENGTIRATTDYFEGKMDGYSINYAKNGEIEYKTRYSKGVKIPDSGKPTFNDYFIDNVSCTIDSITLDRIYFKNRSLFNSSFYSRKGLDSYCKIFAGKYVGVDMSQGSETIRTFIFDCSTGDIFESPLYMYSAEYRSNSRLFVKDPVLDERQQKECETGFFDCSTKYFLWDEKESVFKEIE